MNSLTQIHDVAVRSDYQRKGIGRGTANALGGAGN